MATLARERDQRAENVDEDRFALVSVLQELTVSALGLFDPRSAADAFLERLAERLGCFATVLVSFGDDGRPTLEGASGLSPASRAEPLARESTKRLLNGDGADGLPYRELSGRKLVCWRFPVLSPPGAVLLLYFDGEPALPARYRGMLRRLSEILGRVLEHRQLFARSIENEKRLDQKKTIIECLSESSPGGVMFVDTDGKIAFLNHRFVEMWGLDQAALMTNDTVLEATARQVVDSEDYKARARTFRKNPQAELRDEVVLNDGRVFEREALVVRGAGDVLYGYAVFFRDITERKMAEAERERLLETERAARAAAEESIRMRDEFFSIASHELRTPVTSLLLSTQQVMRTALRAAPPLPETTLRWIENSQRQAERLVRLVDALLDVSRFRAGRLELEREETDLAEVVRDVLARFQHEITASKCQLEVHAEQPVIGFWDRSRIDQIVTNLLSNALKYGRGGAVEIIVRADEANAVLEFRDHGIGIAREELTRLFKRFERAVSSRHYGGFGVGLFIVRQIAEMHGGTVSVESEPNVGSTFTVTLPRHPPATI